MNYKWMKLTYLSSCNECTEKFRLVRSNPPHDTQDAGGTALEAPLHFNI
jgi:hypothetical protein